MEKNLLPANARDALSWIASGIKIERKALGMSKLTKQVTESPTHELMNKSTENVFLEEENTETAH